MKLKIERINEKDINTSRGPSPKLGIFCNGKWYGSWKGQWNSGWKVGDTIDIPDDRISSKTGDNGKVFWNIAGPPKVNGVAASGGGGVTPEQVRQLFTTLEGMRTDILLIKQAVDRLAGEDVQEETAPPPHRVQVTDDDIPF